MERVDLKAYIVYLLSILYGYREFVVLIGVVLD